VTYYYSTFSSLLDSTGSLVVASSTASGVLLVIIMS